MPQIEIKEVAEFLNVEAEDFEGLKAAVNEAYVPKKELTKVQGELNGKFEHALKKVAKEIGIDADELKGKPVLEALPLVGEKVKSRFTELEAGKSATAAEIEERFKAEADTYKQKVNDLKALNETLKSQYEGFKTEVESENRAFKINHQFDGVFSKLPFSKTTTEITKRGFKSLLTEKYQFDLSEEGAPVIRDKAGNIVQSKVKAGTPATFEEVFTAELKAEKLDGVVDTNKIPTFAAPASRVTAPSGGGNAPQRYQPRLAR
jgi:regulator of RNase E activity RraB